MTHCTTVTSNFFHHSFINSLVICFFFLNKQEPYITWCSHILKDGGELACGNKDLTSCKKRNMKLWIQTRIRYWQRFKTRRQNHKAKWIILWLAFEYSCLRNSYMPFNVIILIITNFSIIAIMAVHMLKWAEVLNNFFLLVLL